jgi:hypothetical protein
MLSYIRRLVLNIIIPLELVQIFVYLHGTKLWPLHRSEHPWPLWISRSQYGTCQFSFCLLDCGGGSYIVEAFRWTSALKGLLSYFSS